MTAGYDDRLKKNKKHQTRLEKAAQLRSVKIRFKAKSFAFAVAEAAVLLITYYLLTILGDHRHNQVLKVSFYRCSQLTHTAWLCHPVSPAPLSIHPMNRHFNDPMNYQAFID